MIQKKDVLSAALYPDVFKDYMIFKEEFGPVHGLPTRLFFVGPEIGEEFEVQIEPGKTLNLKILAIGEANKQGKRELFCEVNGQLRPFWIEDRKETKVPLYCFTVLLEGAMGDLKGAQGVEPLVKNQSSFCGAEPPLMLRIGRNDLVFQGFPILHYKSTPCRFGRC